MGTDSLARISINAPAFPQGCLGATWRSIAVQRDLWQDAMSSVACMKYRSPTSSAKWYKRRREVSEGSTDGTENLW